MVIDQKVIYIIKLIYVILNWWALWIGGLYLEVVVSLVSNVSIIVDFKALLLQTFLYKKILLKNRLCKFAAKNISKK